MTSTIDVTDPQDPQCSVVTADGKRCPWPKVKGSPYCEVHDPIMHPTPGQVHAKYGRYLPENLQKLFIEMVDDVEFFSMMEEVALHRTLLCDYLNRMSMHVNEQTQLPDPLPPDPQVVCMYTESIRRNLESQKGRRYLLGPTGAGFIIEGLIEVIMRHFGDQPQRLREVLADIKGLQVTEEHMFGTNRPSGMRQAGAYPDNRNNKYGWKPGSSKALDDHATK